MRARDLETVGAWLVAASVSAHVLMLHHLAPLPALLMVAMVAVCLSCAVALARGGSTRTWLVVTVMGTLMLLVHHAWSLHEPHGHGAVLSLVATLTAGAEVVVGLVAISTRRTGRAWSPRRA